MRKRKDVRNPREVDTNGEGLGQELEEARRGFCFRFLFDCLFFKVTSHLVI